MSRGPEPVIALDGSVQPVDDRGTIAGVITRDSGYLTIRTDAPSDAAAHLEDQGFALLPSVLAPDEVDELRADIDRVFDEEPPDIRREDRPARRYEPFRYEMLNRSAACQRAIGHPAVLEVIEPLLGEDCHVIANTAWRQGPGDDEHGGRRWHIDSGPHVLVRPASPGTGASRTRCSPSPPTSSWRTRRSSAARPA